MVSLAWISVACSVADPAVSAPPDNVDRVVHDHYRKWYRDADRDGYGDPDAWQRSLTRPPAHVANATDCDDDAATAHPGAEEICGNGDDDDCDGDVDECTMSIADAALRVDGPRENSAFGEDVVVADVDADAVADLMMPAWVDDSVYVLYGPTSGVWASSSLVTLSGPSGSTFGTALDGGDVDGDGVGDVVVGAPEPIADSAYLFLGPLTGDRDAGDADAIFEGPAGSGTGLGTKVVPDFDGDGGADVVIGAVVQGAVYVAPGATSGTVDLATVATHIYEGSTSGGLGFRNAELGDTNGDGITDLAIAAPWEGTNEEGALYVVEGGATPGTYDVDAAATAIITSGKPGSYFGYALATPDYDGDGTTDLLVGACRTPIAPSTYGTVYGFLGPLSGSLDTRDAAVTWTSSTEVEYLGIGVSAGDVDGDKSVDVVMGALVTSPTGYGAAFLQLGLASGTVDVNTLLAIRGSVEAPQLGSSTALVPDWTGDGGDEVAVGDDEARDAAGDNVGAVFVFLSDELHF